MIHAASSYGAGRVGDRSLERVFLFVDRPHPKRTRAVTIATGGPYWFVRHPSYVGTILFSEVEPRPLMLGYRGGRSSQGGLDAILFVIRTALEEKRCRRNSTATGICQRTRALSVAAGRLVIPDIGLIKV